MSSKLWPLNQRGGTRSFAHGTYNNYGTRISSFFTAGTKDRKKYEEMLASARDSIFQRILPIAPPRRA
jgi:hypothetical protein